MKKTLSKALSLIIVVVTLLTAYISVQASGGGGTGVLEITYDTATPRHQALTMKVDSVASTSSTQAFCVGWNFTFSNPSVSTTPVDVYVPLKEVDKDGGYRTYTFPLTKGWILEYTGISGGQSIRDLVTDKAKYDSIIKAGCTVTANARIQKYSYSPNPAPKGTFTSLNTYANTKDEIAKYDSQGRIIGGNFTEFTSSFITNTINDYYELIYTLSPEPMLPTPAVNITLPINGITVVEGTEVTFKVFGTGCHHIAGYVNGQYIGVQNNPNSDIAVQTKYETTVKLDTIGDYTFQGKGRNTASETEDGTILSVSNINTVHVIAKPPNSGDIYIKCLDFDTNTEIQDTAQKIPGVVFGEARTINMPVIANYDGRGSYQTYSTVFPDKSKMTSATSQTVTLSSGNQNAYVYFWYKAKPPAQNFQPPIAVIQAPNVEYAGNDVNFSGSGSYDPDGYITNYVWTLSGAAQPYPQNNVNGSTWYSSVGTYEIGLAVRDNEGYTGNNSRYINIIAPSPQAKVTATGILKENRRITLDATQSISPAHYPINWSKTVWKIEPISNLSGAAMTWSSLAVDDAGVRLENGTVTTISTITNQTTLLKGQKKIDFQTRKAGVYKVTLYVENTAGTNYNSTAVQLITVEKDQPPKADFTITSNNTRDKNNPAGQNYGILYIHCISTSPDGDRIGKRTWTFKYDADNDGNFDEKYTAGSGGIVTIPEECPRTGILKSAFNPADWAAKFNPKDDLTWMQLVTDSENDTSAYIYSFEVGEYAPALYIEEYIGPDITIMELIKPSDYRSDYIKSW